MTETFQNMTETLQNMTDLHQQQLRPCTRTGRLLIRLLAMGLVTSSLASSLWGQQVPTTEPQPRPDQSSQEVPVMGLGNKLYLEIQAGANAKREVRIPRLAATIRRWEWREGQGGSDAKIELLREESVEAELQFSVEETGHFQNFRWRTLGTIRLSAPGDYELKLSALRIAHAALLDVRAIHLVRQAKPE